MGKKYDISDAQLDEILSQVGDMAEALAKSESKTIEKAEPKDMKKDDKPEEEAPKGDEPKADESAAPAPEAEAGAPPAGDQAPDAEGAPEGEGDMGGEMSDEELQQIYGSMEPQELERHYMVIRQILQGYYSEGQGEAASAPEAPAPAPEAPAMKAEMSGQKNGGSSGGIPSAESGVKGGGAPKAPSGNVQKSEADPEKDAMKAELEALKGQVGNLVVALEKSFKPKQKAITGIEYISKSEAEEVKPSGLSKEAKKAKLSEIVKSEPGKLSSDEKNAINRFFLYGEEDSKLDKIISGGK
jgi:hypothetical protein